MEDILTFFKIKLEEYPVCFSLDSFSIKIDKTKLTIKEKGLISFTINKWGLGANPDLWDRLENRDEDSFFKSYWLNILTDAVKRAISLDEAAKVLPFPIQEEFNIGELYLLDFLKDYHPNNIVRREKLKKYQPLQFHPKKDIADVYDKLLDLLVETSKITLNLVSFDVIDSEECWLINKKKQKFAFVYYNGDILLINKCCPIGNLFNEGFKLDVLY